MRRQLQQLIESPVRTLQLFAAGALSFFCGLGLLFYIDGSMSVDLRSEMLALLAMLLMACGFLVAITAQLLFILQRLRR